MYNDIRSRPLLPAPHMIRTLNIELGSNEEQNEGHEDDDGAQAQRPPHRSRQLSSGSFMNLGFITLDASFKRVSRWWRNAQEDNENELPSGSTSQLDLPSLSTNQASSEAFANNMLVPQCTERSLLSSSSHFPQGSTSIGALSIRSMFGGKSNLSINKSEGFASVILTRGFTAIPYGWHAEGDGLDKVVRFPQATKPSTLGSKFAVLQSSDLMVEQELDE